jgi:hypothetical protein
MTWYTVAICASVSLALAALFKYGFMFLVEWLHLRFDRKVAEQVIEKHGDTIAEGIIISVSERVTAGRVPNDNTKSASFKETRRENN